MGEDDGRGNEAGNREGRMVSKHLKNSSFLPFWVKKKEALKLLFERYRLEAKMYCHRGSFQCEGVARRFQINFSGDLKIHRILELLQSFHLYT